MVIKWTFSLFAFIYLTVNFQPMRCLAIERENLFSDLSYELIYPENQKDKTLGYFNLNIDPGQEQTLSLILYNRSSSELNTKINLNGAKTTSNGKVDYGPSDLKKDKSLKYELTDVLKGPDHLTIPANGKKQVDFFLKLHKDTPLGELAGGIQIMPIKDKFSSNKESEDFVENDFAYLVGVLLQVGDIKNIQPKLKLNEVKIRKIKGETQLLLNLSNINAVYLEDMKIIVEVSKYGKKSSLFTYEKSNMRMAPNSYIEFPVELADKGLKPGMYTAEISVNSSNNKEWSWINEFTLTEKEVERMVQESNSSAERSYLTIKQTFFAATLFLIIISFSLMIYMNRKKKLNCR